MLHSSGVLIEELTALRSIGNATGKKVMLVRMDSLDFETRDQYLAYLNEHLHNVSSVYARLESAGAPMDGLEDLMPQLYSCVFASDTGWTDLQTYTGAQRIPAHLIDKLKFFKTLSRSFVPSVISDASRLSVIQAEIDSLRAFITESGIPDVDASLFISRLNSARSLLDHLPCDLVAVAEHLSATLGMLAMYASKINNKKTRKAWQSRMKTAALVLGTDLMVSLSTQTITTSAATMLGISS